MIEKLARAMLADELALTPNRDFDAVWAEEGPAWLANARACLEALREPTPRMVERASELYLPANCSTYLDEASLPPDSAKMIWQSMIDVALERKAA